MNKIKKSLMHFARIYVSLNLTTKILVALALIFGCAIRYVNLFHPGYAFDTVGTQYEWGLNADRMGLVGFWRSYTGFFDYLPGALYLLGGLRFISKFFGDNSHTFVIALKSLNWLADIGFAAAIGYVAKRYGRFSDRGALLLMSFVYVMPSIWFVSEVWGQFDTVLVLLTLMFVIVLYKGVEQTDKSPIFYKDYIFWSGVVFALSFWFKMQSALVLPVLLLFHLSYRNMSWVFRQGSGWVATTVLITAMPFIVNPVRLVVNTVQPFIRGDEVTKGGATFWTVLNLSGSGAAKLFSFYGFGLTISQTGLLIFATMMIILVVRYFKLNPLKFYIVEKLLPNKLSFLDFTLFMAISSSLYFMLLTKMHSRYLHMGLLFGFVAFAAMRTTQQSKKWFWCLFFLNFSYFFNQVVVYGGGGDPKWVGQFGSSFNFSLFLLSGFINSVAVLGMYILILGKKQKTLIPEKALSAA